MFDIYPIHQGCIKLIKGTVKAFTLLQKISISSNDCWKFGFAITGMNSILKYIKIQTIIFNWNNIIAFIYSPSVHNEIHKYSIIL